MYMHLRWAFSCAAFSVEVYGPPSFLCPMHMLSIPFPLLIWRLWCPSANGPCFHLFSQGYWACCSFPTLSDGSRLSPAVLVSQRGSCGHRSQSPACDSSYKARSWCTVYANFCTVFILWAAGLRPSSPGPPCPYQHPQSPLKVSLPASLVPVWMNCKGSPRAKGASEASPQCRISGTQNSSKPTHRAILMSGLWQSHTPALSLSWSLRKAAHFSYRVVQLNYHKWNGTHNY